MKNWIQKAISYLDKSLSKVPLEPVYKERLVNRLVNGLVDS